MKVHGPTTAITNATAGDIHRVRSLERRALERIEARVQVSRVDYLLVPLYLDRSVTREGWHAVHRDRTRFADLEAAWTAACLYVGRCEPYDADRRATLCRAKLLMSIREHDPTEAVDPDGTTVDYLLHEVRGAIYPPGTSADPVKSE